jgi:phenylacetate-CoA ligase
MEPSPDELTMASRFEQTFENLYAHLNVSGQNALLSMYGLIYKHRRLGTHFRPFVEEFRKRDRWSNSLMQAYLDENLRRILLHAWDEVPYYKDRWYSSGLSRHRLAHFQLQDLNCLPVTPKADLRLKPLSFIASAAARHRRPLREMTSGSTGEPVVVTSTPELQQAFLAAREERSFGWAGTSILRPRATIGGRRVVPRANSRGPYYRYNWAERQCYFSAFHISPSHVADYVEGLNRYRPQVLTGYSSSYCSLARMMLANNLKLDYRPDALVLWADQLTPGMKVVIQEAFGARPYEEYSSAENAVLATECEHGSLHVSSDFGIVEILNDEDQPVPPGKPGRIICTSLLNNVQPLIRYDIGDFASWSERPCRCGRDHLPVLGGLVGRLEDTIVGPDGREVVRIFANLNLRNVIASQIVQERLNLLRVKVIPTNDFCKQDELLIQETIAARRLGDVQVEVECVSELERTERGKIRRVICRLTPEEKEKLKPSAVSL